MKKLSEIVTPIPLLALVNILEGEVVDGATSPEAEPEGEEKFVKLHKTEKHDDRNGNKDDVFKATNVKKDTSKAGAAPKPGFPPEVKESKKIKWIDAPDLSPAALAWGKDDYKAGKKAQSAAKKKYLDPFDPRYPDSAERKTSLKKEEAEQIDEKNWFHKVGATTPNDELRYKANRKHKPGTKEHEDEQRAARRRSELSKKHPVKEDLDEGKGVFPAKVGNADYVAGKKAGRLGLGDYNKEKYKSSREYKRGYEHGARKSQGEATARSKADK